MFLFVYKKHIFVYTKINKDYEYFTTLKSVMDPYVGHGVVYLSSPSTTG